MLANAPEYVASIRAADEAIERDEPGVALADAIAELEAEHGELCILWRAVGNGERRRVARVIHRRDLERAVRTLGD